MQEIFKKRDYWHKSREGKMNWLRTASGSPFSNNSSAESSGSSGHLNLVKSASGIRMEHPDPASKQAASPV
jgi:hypothetical protein